MFSQINRLDNLKKLQEAIKKDDLDTVKYFLEKKIVCIPEHPPKDESEKQGQSIFPLIQHVTFAADLKPKMADALRIMCLHNLISLDRCEYLALMLIAKAINETHLNTQTGLEVTNDELNILVANLILANQPTFALKIIERFKEAADPNYQHQGITIACRATTKIVEKRQEIRTKANLTPGTNLNRNQIKAKSAATTAEMLTATMPFRNILDQFHKNQKAINLDAENEKGDSIAGMLAEEAIWSLFIKLYPKKGHINFSKKIELNAAHPNAHYSYQSSIFFKICTLLNDKFSALKAFLYPNDSFLFPLVIDLNERIDCPENLSHGMTIPFLLIHKNEIKFLQALSNASFEFACRDRVGKNPANLPNYFIDLNASPSFHPRNVFKNQTLNLALISRHPATLDLHFDFLKKNIHMGAPFNFNENAALWNLTSHQKDDLIEYFLLHQKNIIDLNGTPSEPNHRDYGVLVIHRMYQFLRRKTIINILKRNIQLGYTDFNLNDCPFSLSDKENLGKSILHDMVSHKEWDEIEFFIPHQTKIIWVDFHYLLHQRMPFQLLCKIIKRNLELGWDQKIIHPHLNWLIKQMKANSFLVESSAAVPRKESMTFSLLITKNVDVDLAVRRAAILGDLQDLMKQLEKNKINIQDYLKKNDGLFEQVLSSRNFLNLFFLIWESPECLSTSFIKTLLTTKPRQAVFPLLNLIAELTLKGETEKGETEFSYLSRNKDTMNVVSATLILDYLLRQFGEFWVQDCSCNHLTWHFIYKLISDGEHECLRILLDLQTSFSKATLGYGILNVVCSRNGDSATVQVVLDFFPKNFFRKYVVDYSDSLSDLQSETDEEIILFHLAAGRETMFNTPVLTYLLEKNNRKKYDSIIDRLIYYSDTRIQRPLLDLVLKVYPAYFLHADSEGNTMLHRLIHLQKQQEAISDNGLCHLCHILYQIPNKKISLNAKNNKNESPLHLALKFEFLQLTTHLLHNITVINKSFIDSDCYEYVKNDSIMMKALWLSAPNLEGAMWLANHDILLDLDPKLTTPLHVVALLGSLKLVDHFIQIGANVNARDEKNRTPSYLGCATEIRLFCYIKKLEGMKAHSNQFMANLQNSALSIPERLIAAKALRNFVFCKTDLSVVAELNTHQHIFLKDENLFELVSELVKLGSYKNELAGLVLQNKSFAFGADAN